MAESGGGLSAEQRAQLQAARARLAPIERATRWATFTYWTVGGFGALTVLSGLVAQLTTTVYGAVIVIVDIVQLFMARFHFRREAQAEAFRQETPDWVLEVLGGPGAPAT